jgi:hypothetical protein
VTTYRRENGVAQVQGPDRVTLLLVSEPGSRPVALTGSGIAVWEELGPGPRELEQVVSAVAQRFQVTESVVASDVRGLCHKLVLAGFLVAAEDDEGSADR